MSESISYILFFLYALVPAVLLIFKFVTKKPAWWLIFLILVFYVLIGWGCLFLAYAEEQARISEIIDNKQYEELPEGWDSDGASGVFALFLGWIVPLFYFVFWLTLYSFLTLIKRIFKAK